MGFIDFLEWDGVGVGSREFIVMRSRPGIPITFPYFLARTQRFRDFAIKRVVRTSGRQRLAARDLAVYALGRPGAGELQAFGGLAGSILGRVKAAVDESGLLAQTRDELLPLLISG